MEKSHNELTGELVGLLEKFYVEMRCNPAEGWSDIELTVPQLRTLAFLRQGPQRMGQIAEFLGSSLPSATSMIDRLVDRGLVERTHGAFDRRVVTCKLTAKGQDEVDRFWQIERMGIVELANQLSSVELEKVVEAILLLQKAAQKVQSNSPITSHTNG